MATRREAVDPGSPCAGSESLLGAVKLPQPSTKSRGAVSGVLRGLQSELGLLGIRWHGDRDAHPFAPVAARFGQVAHISARWLISQVVLELLRVAVRIPRTGARHLPIASAVVVHPQVNAQTWPGYCSG